METLDPLLDPMNGTEHLEINGVQIDMGKAGCARVRRIVYPVGFRWSTHIKPVAGTDVCLHGHAGFVARGHIRIAFADGCTLDFVAPQILEVEPGHDGWVVGEEPAVLIEFDFERDTLQKLGLRPAHAHTPSRG